MSYEAHQWGESAAADAVRELVVGLAPSVARKRLLVSLQAFVDDSYDARHFVLAGHIASADVWEAFSREWEEILPLGIRDKDGFYFKMSEMALLQERMDRLPAFWRVMENHILLPISVHFRINDFERAKQRIFVRDHNINWGDVGNTHFFAFRALLDMFHVHKEKVKKVPLDQPVDFIFDEHTMKKPLLEAWDRYMAMRPANVRPRYGSTPIFRDDRQFLPLQAADLWAWWVREWYETGKPLHELMAVPDFGSWKAKEGMDKFVIQFNEDHLAENLMALVAAATPTNVMINDRKTQRAIPGTRPVR